LFPGPQKADNTESSFLCLLGLLWPNLEPSGPVERIKENGGFMSFLNKLLGKSDPPKPRVQVCVECGMPVADHKQWCSILQGQNEMKLKAAEKKTA
jgi:hypothetical protein